MNGEKWLPRPKYLNKVRNFYGTDLIKVFLGQRRVGKSGLLHLVEQDWKASGFDGPILYVDKEKREWARIGTGDELLAEVHAMELKSGERSLVLVDEIQEINEFAPALRSLAGEGRYDLFVTGSNARLLSGEIATYFAGRAVTFRIHSLSYAEFLDFHHRADSDDSLMRYLRYGGLPYLAALPDIDTVLVQYLDAVVDTVVLRDVVERFGVRKTVFLRNLVRFCADTIGSQLSAKRISDYLKSQHLKVSPQVVIDYLEHLAAAFLIDRCKRFDIQGRRLFEIGEKIYFEDLGMRTALRGFDQQDLAKVIENAAYLKLRQDGWDVSVGVWEDREIDLVGNRGEERIYVQVALTVLDEKTRQREFGNLLKIDDNFPKYVVSLDTMRADDRGIRHLSLREFLLAELGSRTT